MARRLRNTVLASLELMRRRCPALNVSGMLVLLYVAENPGVSTADLAELCGFTAATASRTARALLPAHDAQALHPGLGLLEDRPASPASRLRAFHLSEAGHEICREIDAFIARGPPIDSRAR